jgi:hypothetical protein
MDRDAIISFIEKIRPQIKAAGAPEDVLLAAAREHNLAPAQLESTAQLLNTAQQLHFMDKAAHRGDSFNLIDVPDLLSRFVSHKVPSGILSEKSASFSDRMEAFEKSGRVQKREDNYVLLSKDGKVLGTHKTAQDAWKQEYAIQKSQEHRAEKAASVALEDPTLARPLTGNRIPHINNMVRKDAGVAGNFISLGEAPPALPPTERTKHRERLQKEAKLRYELEGLSQLLDDQHECLRKEAESIATRFRMEPAFNWAEAKSDALVIAKEATEQAAPVLEAYLTQLGSTPGAGHRKVAFSTEPAPQPGVLVEDRHNIVGSMEKMAQAIERIAALQMYEQHVKTASMTEPPGIAFSNRAEKGKRDEEEEEEARGKSDAEGEDRPAEGVPQNAEELGDQIIPGSASLNRPSLEEILVPPGRVERDADIINADWSKSIDDAFSGVGNALKRVPGPQQIQNDALSLIESMKPKSNKKQMTIDNAVTDVRTVTNLQRLMMTDPIIRDAEPEMVMSLYNTLQNANPEVARDPNLLRFALREALQYESVPLHTYRDLVEVEEKKQKSRDVMEKNQERRYSV